MSPFQKLLRFPYALILIAICLVSAGQSVWAQFNLGTVTGTVHDPNGAIVADCKITAVSLADSNARTVVTNAQGVYVIPSVPAGKYRITAESPGFQKSSAELTVGVDQTITFDLDLALGNVTEQVEVKAETDVVALQRDTHEISHLVNTKQLEDLPTNGRNFLTLATLGTGAQPARDAFVTAGGPVSNFGSVGREVILAGQFVGSTTFLQDGVVNVNLLTQTANIVASMESIQEASVESNGMSAKFASPGVVNVITKRGTNAFHGAVYDYLQNDAFNARSFFASSVPVLRYNQFGANLGGPILKDKLFAFFDYAGQRQTSFGVSRNRVPTDAERQGDFQTAGVTVFDPATYNAATGTIAPFANNTIPANRLDPSAARYLAYFPSPNQALVNGINYQTSLGNTNNFDQYLGRLDYNLSSKDSLMGSVQTSDSPVLQPSIVNGLFGTVYQTSGKNASLQDIHVFSPSVLNIARLGYNRSILFLSQQAVGEQDYVAQFGLQNLNLPKNFSIPPAVTISGCCALGSPTNPQGGTQNLFQFADEVNWTVGRHQIFFGAEVDRLQFNGTWLLFNGGQYTFTGLYTSNHLTGSRQKLGPSTADFLLGYPSSASGGQGIPDGAFRETDVGAYIQDNWKVTPKLTLNLGLRYQYYQPTHDKWNKAAIIDLPTNTVHQGTWEPTKLSFGPRVGLAYSFNDKTVIRSGFGIYYNQQPYNFLQFLIANAPVYVLQSVTLTAATPVNWTQVFSATPGKSAQSPFTEGLRMPTPYVEQWNFGIQRSIGSGLVTSVSYVGNQSHHQPLRLNPNQGIQDPDPANPTPLANRRPYSFVGDVYGQYNIQNANYHSLQASLKYRFSNGFSLLGSYTYSKAMDIADAGATLPVNGLDAKGSSYGPANFDRAHIFTASYSYELPIGTGKTFLNHMGWVSRQVIGGWQLSGITTLESGLPFSVTANDLSNTGGIHSQVADRTCNGNLPSDHRSISHWFDTACFSQPAAGRLGNSGRNPLWAPGAANFDLSAFKRFPFGEQRWVQFRTDFFSAFNHPMFSTGNQSTSSSTYGQITSATGARVVQFSLKVAF
jgi:outer membrane receptor protein involved in Fe transport